MSWLLKNVTPIPKVAGMPERVDVLIGEGGSVERVAPNLQTSPDAQTVDATSCYLSPGWVDLHTHIYYGATDISVRPEEAGLPTGVTTLVDTGSAGEANFHGFREYIIDRAREDVYAFLNLGSIGLVACNRVSELQGIHSIDLGRAVDVIERNRDVIKGVKIRASHVITGDWGVTPLRLAKKLSRIAELPLMVHIGEPPPLLDEVFGLLDPGDIVTHCFNGKVGGNIYDDLTVNALARRTLERGVLFDIGHGSASFSFEVAERAFREGIKPHSISTDLHAHNINGPVFDLATTASKLYSLGLSLEDVVEAVTFNPLKALRLPYDRTTWLAEGAPATFTIFELLETDIRVEDSQGECRTLHTFINPRYALLRGQLVEAASRSLEQKSREKAGVRA